MMMMKTQEDGTLDDDSVVQENKPNDEDTV